MGEDGGADFSICSDDDDAGMGTGASVAELLGKNDFLSFHSGALGKGRPGRPGTSLMSDCK